MKEIDSNYWITGVELGQRRGILIQELLDLMDRKYQEEKWIYETKQGGQESFYSEFAFCAEMFDDQNMFKAVREKRIPYDDIGWSLKNKKEAEVLYEMTKPLQWLSHNCYYNKEFLESKELPELRELSLEAFLVFMENEKENEEFCKFILELITNERCQELKTEGRSAYDAILEYTTICRKYNNAKS